MAGSRALPGRSRLSKAPWLRTDGMTSQLNLQTRILLTEKRGIPVTAPGHRGDRVSGRPLQSNRSCCGLTGHRQSASVCYCGTKRPQNQATVTASLIHRSAVSRVASTLSTWQRPGWLRWQLGDPLLVHSHVSEGPLVQERASLRNMGRGFQVTQPHLCCRQPAQIQGEGTLLPDKVLGGHMGRETVCGHFWEAQPAPWGWRLAGNLTQNSRIPMGASASQQHLSEPGRCFFPKYGFGAAPPCPGRSLRSRLGVFCRL